MSAVTAALISLQNSGSAARCPSGYVQSYSTLQLLINGVNQSLVVQSCDNNPQLIADKDNTTSIILMGVFIPLAVFAAIIVSCMYCRCARCCFRNSNLFLTGRAAAVPLKADNQIVFEALGTNLHRQFQMGVMSAELDAALHRCTPQQLDAALYLAGSLGKVELMRSVRLIMESRGEAIPFITKVTPSASAPHY